MSAAGWLLLSEESLPADDDWLSEAEREVLAGLRFDRRRRDWRLGRWTARRALEAAASGRGRVASFIERGAERGEIESSHRAPPLPSEGECRSIPDH